MKKNYTREELHRLMEQMRDEFQLVRLVEPLSRRVCDEKTLLTTDEVCHSVWDRLERCENCSSGRALSEGETFMLRKAVKPKLLALFVGICTFGIIVVGYLFNIFQSALV